MLHANERLAISVREAAQMLSVSPRTIQKYITAGLLPARKIGHRTVVPIHSLEAFLRIDHTSPRHHTSPKEKHTDNDIGRWTTWLGLGIAVGKFIQVAISFFYGGSE